MASETNESNDKQYYSEEFKALRAEIQQNQRDNFTIIELGLTATAALLTIAYSQFLDRSARWIFLFTPSLILVPLSMLIAQRSRATYKIGNYIADVLEPILGFSWEQQSRTSRTKERRAIEKFTLLGFELWEIPERKTISFVWGSGLSFILIELFCVFLSIMDLLILSKFNEIVIIGSELTKENYIVFSDWFYLVWALLALIIILTIFLFQWPMLNEARSLGKESQEVSENGQK